MGAKIHAGTVKISLNNQWENSTTVDLSQYMSTVLIAVATPRHVYYTATAGVNASNLVISIRNVLSAQSDSITVNYIAIGL